MRRRSGPRKRDSGRTADAPRLTGESPPPTVPPLDARAMPDSLSPDLLATDPLRDVVRRLREGTSRVPTQAVRAAVVAYARALHDDGVAPDRMLLAVRHVAEELPTRLSSAVEVWAIEAYYGETTE